MTASARSWKRSGDRCVKGTYPLTHFREEDVFKAQRQLTRDIWALFMEKGIEIPFPQVVVHQG